MSAAFEDSKAVSKLPKGLAALDQILRGKATRPEDLEAGDVQIPLRRVATWLVALAMVYGLCMGVFALCRGFENSQYFDALMQTLASSVKVPFLFFLTLVVTFPSLYVFNAIVGSQLRLLPVLKLLIAAMGVNLSVLASLGPIVAFFSVSTPNYHFIVLLNVAVFAIAGGLGLAFLVQTLNRLTLSQIEEIPHSVTTPDAPMESNESPSHWTGPLAAVDGNAIRRNVLRVFTIWILVFGLVGAQMGWVLRPFIGSPDKPFAWFRPRDSNFFEAVLNCLWGFLTGG